jgi:hypothetical protein
VEGGAEIDVEDAERGGWTGPEQLMDEFATLRSALGKSAEAEDIAGGDLLKGGMGDGDVIPGDILDDLEVVMAVGGGGDDDGAGGEGGVTVDEAEVEAAGGEGLKGLIAEGIGSDGGDEVGLGAEGVGVEGEIGRGAAETGAIREEVPEEFTDGDEGRGMGHGGPANGGRG